MTIYCFTFGSCFPQFYTEREFCEKYEIETTYREWREEGKSLETVIDLTSKKDALQYLRDNAEYFDAEDLEEARREIKNYRAR